MSGYNNVKDNVFVSTGYENMQLLLVAQGRATVAALALVIPDVIRPKLTPQPPTAISDLTVTIRSKVEQ